MPGVALGMRRLSASSISRPASSRSTTKIAPSGSCSTARSTTTAELRARTDGTRPSVLHQSDTETIVHAYEQWGAGRVPPAARHVRHRDLGRAATRSLLLARDRVGIKPLHYARVGRSPVLRIRDQVDPRRAGDIGREIDFDALDHYLSFLYTPRDGSIFAGIRKLPPGHVLSWQDGRDPRSSGTGNCRPSETFSRNRKTDAVEKLRAGAARRGPIASDQRRAARRVSVRRRRFERWSSA